MQSLYSTQAPKVQQQLLMEILKEKKLIEGPPYPIESFTAATIMPFTMITQVLRLTSALSVTEAHQGALLFLCHIEEEGHKEYIIFCKHLSESMDRELQDFLLTRTFRYQAYLIHLFLHQQFSFMGHLRLDMVGSDHKVKPTSDWCPRVRSTVDNENLRW